MLNKLFRQYWLQILIPLLLVIWTLVVLYLTLMPSDSVPSSGIFSYNEIGPFGMVGGWTGLVGLYVMIIKKHPNPPFVGITVAGIIFGILSEMLQFIMPFDRSGGFSDILINSAGCLTAYVVLEYLRWKLKIWAEENSSTLIISATSHF